MAQMAPRGEAGRGGSAATPRGAHRAGGALNGLGFRGLGFRGLGFRVWGLGFRVYGSTERLDQGLNTLRGGYIGFRLFWVSVLGL